MHRTLLLAIILAGSLRGYGRSASGGDAGLPKNAAAILSEAAPFYNFADTALKPWHLKATYQLYDEKGAPTEQGTYEYWWASSKVYRSTWTRPGATHTDWHTYDGQHRYAATGEPLKYFEYKVQSALLSPLPSASELDPSKGWLDLQTRAISGAKFPCVMLAPKMPERFGSHTVLLGLFPTYCFDSKSPILRLSASFGTVQIVFNKIVETQGKYLARDIEFYRDRIKILSIAVDAIGGIDPSDAVFTPSAHALGAKTEKVNIAGKVAMGSLIKRQMPLYPRDAKDARISGTVVLQAMIGRDGGVYDLHVISTPWPSLAASALWAVSHWEYKPYRLNGEPVEVETTVNVVYSLGP